MIEYFKNIIAHYIVNRQLKHKKDENQSFTNLMKKAFTFLVIMPENEKDFQHSIEVLKFLSLEEKHITIFSYDYRRNLINPKYRPATIEYGVADVTKLNLPARNFVELLGSKKFNAIIDLNRGDNLFCSYAANLVQSQLRIGFSKTNSDKFYNIQIADVEDNPEISYKNFLNCLQMF